MVLIIILLGDRRWCGELVVLNDVWSGTEGVVSGWRRLWEELFDLRNLFGRWRSSRCIKVICCVGLDTLLEDVES